MAQEIDKPLDNGKIGLPKVDGAMNKISPSTKAGNKGEKEAKKLAATKEQELLTRARKRMDRCIRNESDNRKAALEDLKFRAGDQWQSDIKAKRVTDKRPCETVNKLPTLIHQVCNDIRENRPTIDVHPVGDRADKEIAKFFRGMIRHIERSSHADIAYDNGVELAVTMGWGYWRILTEYESHNSFDECITIQRIRNPFTVYLDPDCQEPDGADSRYAFVSEMIPRDEFTDTYPDADPIAWDATGVGERRNWSDENNIRIAEYFEIRNKTKTLVYLSNGSQGYKDDLGDDILDMIDSGELTIERERDAPCPQVMWYKITAKEILDKKEWIGKWIPIVRCIGDEIDVEGKVQFSGMIRHAKGPQRVYNYFVNSQIELAGMSPKTPYIMAEGQEEGHEDEWKTANTENRAYLTYKQTDLEGKPAPPPTRVQPAQIPAALIQVKQDANQDMMATTGVRFDVPPMDMRPGQSGSSLKEMGRITDVGAFHYVDNLTKSLRHTGRILVDLIPKIYDRPRSVTILRDDDQEERVKINPNLNSGFHEGKDDNGKTQKSYNPTLGEYAVTINTGPSYSTKRQEASESMIKFMQMLPPTIAPVIADLIAKNMDWPGSEEMATRLAKTLDPKLLTPDQKDVPPQVAAMIQGLQKQIQTDKQQIMTMAKDLTDKKADQAIKKDKIDKDFEAKLLAIAAKLDGDAQKDLRSAMRDVGLGDEGAKQLVDVNVDSALAKAMELLNQPRRTRIVRDPHGRPIQAIEEGIQTESTGHPSVDILVQHLGAPRVKTIERDATGRAVGATTQSQ